MYYYYELAGRKWQEWLPDFQAVELFYPRLLTDPTVRQIGDTAERKKGRQEDGNQPWNFFLVGLRGIHPGTSMYEFLPLSKSKFLVWITCRPPNWRRELEG